VCRWSDLLCLFEITSASSFFAKPIKPIIRCLGYCEQLEFDPEAGSLKYFSHDLQSPKPNQGSVNRATLPIYAFTFYIAGDYLLLQNSSGLGRIRAIPSRVLSSPVTDTRPEYRERCYS